MGGHEKCGNIPTCRLASFFSGEISSSVTWYERPPGSHSGTRRHIYVAVQIKTLAQVPKTSARHHQECALPPTDYPQCLSSVNQWENWDHFTPDLQQVPVVFALYSYYRPRAWFIPTRRSLVVTFPRLLMKFTAISLVTLASFIYPDSTSAHKKYWKNMGIGLTPKRKSSAHEDILSIFGLPDLMGFF